MRRRFFEVSGFVLAGGESRRMGRPKEQLVLGHETMLDRQVRVLGSVTRSVAVVGPSERWSGVGFRVISDQRAGLGPIGGIVTGLACTRTEYNLFVGCDMPFLTARFLEYLCAQATLSKADATIPESQGGRLHPTCAVYRRRALQAAGASIELGDFSVRSFFPRVKCRVLHWPEIARAGFGPAIFENMNTPEDYHRAVLRLTA
ncbi:MAG TPA: molybdenum cofactor guanylyltransferase [Terriglobia bacterium]|nr:molybdenum cofactor guanylyltransferase [Terriglobia bacterium]